MASVHRPTAPSFQTPSPHTGNGTSNIKLCLGALGVVYGDIGTSPLYAIKECFAGHVPLDPTPDNVLGVL